MEYLILADRPFREIEAQTIRALQGQGFAVQRTFSLDSATVGASDEQHPGFSVLMLYAGSAIQQPLGLLTIYGNAGQMVLKAMLKSSAQETEAELVAALSLGGLDFCVHAAGGLNCIEPDGQVLARNDDLTSLGHRESDH
jgi:hypothetical protein